ncbi:MAG TPA: ribonuclease III [Cellvibrionaceae bacterium]|nr:ribonuclease III [Cellvibrionaceae bacterium]HMW72981.1 ribonuclease III [Cellvibrionaceae bacterium]HMY38803.1 ribonuclease III [Marinagarivorans sp.]
MTQPKNNHLAHSLGYKFSNPDLLHQALTHRSFGATHNERLEFLGDSILNLVIAEALFEKFPTAKEGDLSRLRASLVKGDTLAEVARDFGLGEYLRLGEGELRSGGQMRSSILADAVEAIIGAIFLDAGFMQARQIVRSWFQARMSNMSLAVEEKDPKTLLQELLQGRKKQLPVYEVVEVEGESHAQVFTVSCTVAHIDSVTTGVASNRRAAEKEAAEKMLALLKP